MITLYDYMTRLRKLIVNNPNLAGVPVAFANDEEENEYRLVQNNPTLCQMHDISAEDLEMVGFYDKNSKDIARGDINCVIIN